MAKTDERTIQLIKEVAKQKAEIAKAEKPNWRTNCSYQVAPGSSVNLHVESNLRVLIGICGAVMAGEAEYDKAAESLGLTDYPPFDWGGYSASDWIVDVRSRINKIQIGSKRKKLEDLEARLNKIISPELRAEIELEAISAELK